MNYRLRPTPYHAHKPWYEARNMQIVIDRDNGMTWHAMVEKYGVNESYLRVVYSREKNRKKFNEGRKGRT